MSISRQSQVNPAKGNPSSLENSIDNKRTTQQLQEALDFAENILATIREPLVILGADLRIISANRSFYQAFSVTPPDTEGKLIYEVGKGQWNIPQLRELLESILPKNTFFENYEVDHEFPSLGRRVMFLNARRIHNGGSKTQKILLAIEDVTERRRLEHDMVSSELRYRRLFETAQDGILILNAENGEIADANPFLSDMLGYSKQELLGKKLWEIGFFKDSAASHQAFQILQDKGYVRYEDLPLQNKDERSMAVEFVSNVYTIDGQKVVQCNIRDITERKQAEEKIRTLNESLSQRASELEAANRELDAFSYTVSHDLQAPLRSMLGFSQAIFEDYPDKLDDKGKEYLSYIKESSKQMSGMINDLLKLSRITRGEIQKDTVDLSDLAESVAFRLQRTDQHRAVKFVIAPGIQVLGDSNLLRVALENLLGNAWKYTAKTQQPVIEFGIIKGNSKKTYFVRDTGVGFNMDYVGKLFRPFQRLHSASEFAGTGIGLASVQRIITRHGGRVWAEGEVGKGATFYFTLD
jgi:PAS domain S-box-containing protein